jgi:photosystem II stability/assembly factor-like uncharacterized protein
MKLNRIFYLIFLLFAFLRPAEGQWSLTSAEQIESLCTFGSEIFGGGPGTLIVSSDSGNTWLYSTTFFDRSEVLSLVSSGNYLFAGTLDSGFFRSSDNGITWTKILSNTVYDGITVGSFFITGGDGKVLRTTDFGDHWDTVNIAKSIGTTVDSISYLLTFCSIGSTIFAGTLRRGIMRSTDYGATWKEVNTGVPYTINGVEALASIGTYLIAAVHLKGIYVSSDSGNSWKPIATDKYAKDCTTLLHVGSSIFAGLNQSYGGIEFSSDSGATWSIVGTMERIRKMNIIGDYVVTGTNFGVYRALLSDFGVDAVRFSSDTNLNFSILSNPIRDFVDFRFNTLQRSSVFKIYDLLGKEIFSAELQMGDTRLRIDMRRYPTGAYHIKFNNMILNFLKLS